MALALLDTLKSKLFGAPKKEDCGSMKGSCGTESKKTAPVEEEDDDMKGGCCGGGCH